MIKMIGLFKRKLGMSYDDFVTYYEERHAVLAATYLTGARRYERRYLHALTSPTDGKVREADFDVLTEIWFDDRATLEKVFGAIANSEVADIIARDEENFFDRDRKRLFTVEAEIASDLSAK